MTNSFKKVHFCNAFKNHLIYHNLNFPQLIQFLSEYAPTKVLKTRETLDCVKIQARQIHYTKNYFF